MMSGRHFATALWRAAISRWVIGWLRLSQLESGGECNGAVNDYSSGPMPMSESQPCPYAATKALSSLRLKARA